MAKGFLFANNLMLDTRKTLKRTDDVSQTILKKLDFITEITKNKDLILVLCGSTFTKTFCVKTLSECMDRLKGLESIILADENQMSGGKLNAQSTLGILSKAGLARAVFGNEISKRVDIETDGGEVTFGIVGNRQSVVNDEIVIDHGLFNQMECIYIGDFLADLEFQGLANSVKPYEVRHCALVVASGESTSMSDAKVGKTQWVTPGNVVRHTPAQETLKPSCLIYTPNEEIEFIEIPHDEFVFDSNVPEESKGPVEIEQSNFAKRLKEECSGSEVFVGKIDQSVIDRLCEKRNVSQAAREIIYDLERRYHQTK